MNQTVYKSNGTVYITDNSGTWIVSIGSSNNYYAMDREFIFRRTWISTETMCKYGEYSSYDDMLNFIRTII